MVVVRLRDRLEYSLNRALALPAMLHAGFPFQQFNSTFQHTGKSRKTCACQNVSGTFVMGKTSQFEEVSPKMLRTGTRNTNANFV